ncbi:MAG: sigma-54-dependent Fis family transcriptional regulator [Candidatus Coatesbacteria bacterium]|nr:sigma-54-dependent Fis family transcriptional regulator [Candidatus Coatesbacteria bacterium]
MNKVLIIDDDKAVLNYLSILLMQSGEYQPVTLSDSCKSYDMLQNEKFDLLLLDMDMPKVNGLDILKFIFDNKIEINTVVLTGVEDVELAVSAMKLGAHDYITKPADQQYLLKVMSIAIERGNLSKDKSKVSNGKTELEYNQSAFSDIITSNPKIIKLFHFVEKLAQTNNTILIWGESGTGKELFANAIHKISSRSKKAFIAVNAGVFANELFASEFFGHAKGAFTGADANKKGLLEEADGGTLFLDEIGELALQIQVKLLRFLQEGEFFRVGSTKNQRADVRIIAATNKDLFEEIKKGNFRKDLFYRLNMNSIYLPPLREREGDVEVLSYYFLKKFSELNNKSITKISSAVLDLLNNYSFPGNVRELMNIINSATIIETSNELHKKSLPQYFLQNFSLSDEVSAKDLKTLKEIEAQHIKKILIYTKNNRTRCAQILGISRVNLIAKIKSYSLDKEN